MKQEIKKNRCRAKTRDGKPCHAAATSTGLCFFHGNPKKAAELGRKGGRSKRELNPDELRDLPSLDSMKSVHEMSKRLFEECYTGKRPPKDTNGLVRLLELVRDSIRFTDLEQRIANLEGRSESDESETSRDGESGSALNQDDEDSIQ